MHPTHRLISFPSSTGWCALCTPPYFLWLSPPEVPPSCNIDEAVCIPHAVSFCLFFSSMGWCAPCTLPCFHSFFPPWRQPSSEEINGAACIPHAASFGSLFPPKKTSCMTRQHESHMPPHLGLFFSPWKVQDSVHPTCHLDFFFFFFSLRGSPPAATAMTVTTRQRESYMPPRFPFLFQHQGSVDPTRRLILLHSFINEAVCTLHTVLYSAPQIPSGIR